ncbi:chorismate synthase [Salidesulfovibrio brasiliensis]|uniref:chorismate synthase n=1 Tax=Salidesulfovibrio brasiliensis TaxID=221711 RepID=UPI0006D090C1|nr:chorismate synthase [Salidesulfovibrio brasiliensis]
MSGNTFGKTLKLTTYGESHGPGLGGIVDGCPAGIPMSEAIIQQELDRRKPGQGLASTARKESDTVRLMSGVFEGVTTGTPIGFLIENEDQRSRDYSKVKDVFRPGHADFTYHVKYGGIRDYRGGGRSSGRETVARVAGGAIAQEFLRNEGIAVYAYTTELGGIAAEVDDVENAQLMPFFSPDEDAIPKWEERIKQVKGEGDTLGGVVEVRVVGLPAGIGEPVFDKLDACLAHALMSVGAVKAVEIGSGCDAARSLGSQNNDYMTTTGFSSNNAGGILGGISSGQDIVARAFVKPIPSIAQEQHCMDVEGHRVCMRIGGRHDICAIPRINPVLKAMTAFTIADLMLQDRRLGSRE